MNYGKKLYIKAYNTLQNNVLSKGKDYDKFKIITVTNVFRYFLKTDLSRVTRHHEIKTAQPQQRHEHFGIRCAEA